MSRRGGGLLQLLLVSSLLQFLPVPETSDGFNVFWGEGEGTQVKQFFFLVLNIMLLLTNKYCETDFMFETCTSCIIFACLTNY